MNDEVTEKGVITVTPDSRKLNSATRRNLKSKANISAPPSLTNSEEVPNYLRASTGSCHDFCKYGRKHDSEPKKRRPIFPSFFGIHQTTNEEYKARVPVLRGRKKLEVKLKQLKNEVSSGSKASKQKDLSPATVIIPFARADESSEDMLSISSAGLAEGSLDLPVSIKVMVPSPSMEPVECGTAYQAGFPKEPVECGPAYQVGFPEEPVDYGPPYQAGLFEEATALNNSTSSPTIKNIVAAEHIPLTYGSSEYTFARTIGRSTEEPCNIALMPPSPFEESVASPRNEVGSSSKNSIRKAEISDIEESRLADVATRATEGSISMKPRNKLPVQKNSVLAKHVPYSRASEKFVTSKGRSPIENTDLTAKHVPGSRARKSSEEQQRVTRVGSSDREKRLTELKGARQSQKVVSVRDEVVKQRNIDASGQPNIVKRKTLSPVKKATVSVEPKQTKLKSPTSFKRTIVSGLPKIIKQKATSPPKGLYVKPKTSMLKSTSSVVSSTGLTNQRIQENRSNRSSLTQLGDKKLLRTSRSSVTPNPVNRVASMKLKDRAKVTKREPGTEIVKEKTLYMVEPKQASIDLKRVSQKPRKHEASLSPRFSSSSTSAKDEQSDCNSVFSEACGLVSATKQRSKKPAAVPRVENTEKLRRCSPVGSVDKKPLAAYKLKRNVTVGVVDNKPPSPHKMKFRRGKIINLQPEISGPRRLRFRTVRAVSENQSEVMRRSFRKRRESSSPVMDPPAPEALPLVIRKRRETSSVVMDPPVSEVTPTVVLRHQDVQDRKDTQGLFNNVIEETAKQLVEARKSKVKALVGAFETVISLQEK